MNVIRWINRRWWFFPLCCLLTAPPLVLAVGRWLLPWWLTSPDSILMFSFSPSSAAAFWG